jgi:RNA polymerase sigma-70 factor (ECF subfamily)
MVCATGVLTLRMMSIPAAVYATICEIRARVAMPVKTEEKEDKSARQSSFNVPRDWVKRLRQGDNQAMEAVYERLKSPYFGIAYRYTYNTAAAEDILQDIFIKIFTSIKELEEDEAFTGWAYRIAVNTCLSYLRSKKSILSKTVPFDEVDAYVSQGNDTEHEKMLHQPLDEAIRTLTSKLKSVFLLHDMQGFKHEEIAQILGCSAGTSKSQLFKARLKIRNHLLNKQTLQGEKK